MKSSPLSYHFRKTQERDNGSSGASVHRRLAMARRSSKCEGGTVALGSEFDLLVYRLAQLQIRRLAGRLAFNAKLVKIEPRHVFGTSHDKS